MYNFIRNTFDTEKQ